MLVGDGLISFLPKLGPRVMSLKLLEPPEAGLSAGKWLPRGVEGATRAQRWWISCLRFLPLDKVPLYPRGALSSPSPFNSSTSLFPLLQLFPITEPSPRAWWFPSPSITKSKLLEILGSCVRPPRTPLREGPAPGPRRMLGLQPPPHPLP